ncbi:hypothetical protein KIPB_010011, partial [Kipferlia bialata]
FTGSAGTGKSFLMKAIIKGLQEKYEDELGRPEAVQVTATTGEVTQRQSIPTSLLKKLRKGYGDDRRWDTDPFTEYAIVGDVLHVIQTSQFWETSFHWAYNLVKSDFYVMGPIPCEVYNPAVICIGPNLYLIGGKYHESTVHVYNTETAKWACLATDCHFALDACVGVDMGGGEVLVLGTTPVAQSSDSEGSEEDGTVGDREVLCYRVCVESSGDETLVEEGLLPRGQSSKDSASLLKGQPSRLETPTQKKEREKREVEAEWEKFMEREREREAEARGESTNLLAEDSEAETHKGGARERETEDSWMSSPDSPPIPTRRKREAEAPEDSQMSHEI